MKKRFLTVLLTAFTLLTAVAGRQQPPTGAQQTAPTKEKQQQQSAPRNQDEVVRISVTLVQVDVAVTDKKGRPITDLKPEEVEIYEDGRRQQITNFSFVSSEPAEKAAPSPGVRPNDKQPVVPP